MSQILDKRSTANDGGSPFDSFPKDHSYWLEWLAGLLLVLAFGIQLHYIDHATIHPPQLLCAEWQLACPDARQPSSLPLELKQIGLLDNQVQAHPEVAGALLIQGSLINYRRYALRYPELEIRFFDLTGRVAASRRFQAQEYLLPGVNPNAGLAPGTPVQVRLQVLDPGLATLSYEFQLR